MAVYLSERYLLHVRDRCFSFFSVAVINYSDKKQVVEERSLFQLTIPGYSTPLWGHQGRNFKLLIISCAQPRAERGMNS